jgi:hypothetical protein
MKKRYTEEQIARILREVQSGIASAGGTALISGGVSYSTSRLTLKTSFVQPRFILNDPDGNFWGE